MGRASRRKRLAAVTAGGALLFAATAAVLISAGLRRGDPYRPGEEVEGLTADLARDLPADYPRVAFTNVTDRAGIRFRHFSGRRSSQLPEDMGSGAAWGDYDGDGWIDLYVVNHAGPLDLTPAELAASPARGALYRNLGDGTFREVAEAAGVAFRGFGMAAAWGDYDGDGHIDLVVTAYGSNVLYRNLGNGTFRDVTAEAGLDGPRGFWAGASWADYDRDGDLDLYITGYVRYDRDHAAATSTQYDVETPVALNPSAFPPERNLLYRNEGDGTFTEVAEAAGVAGMEGRSLSAAWTDLDEDGWPDLYVANDVSDNVLYHNRRDGTFREISHEAMVADYRGAMGLAVGDWNGDGDTDLFVTHWIAQENALYDNRIREHFESLDAPPRNRLHFMDVADRRGLGQIALDFIGWGTSFLDYDNDGRPDLLVANGSTFQQPGAAHRLIPMRDQLFWNRGPEEGFYDVSAAAGPYFAETHVGRGAAIADYDNDGDLDVFIVNHGGRAVLLRNDGGNRNRWLQVRLEGARGNRQGIGARVRVVAGGRVQLHEVGAQSSYLSQNSPIAHFGLGDRESVDTLEVRWPSGLRQTFPGVPTNRLLRLAEGEELREAVASAAEPATDRDRVLRFWVLLRQATAHRVAGRVEDAERAYAAALELNPSHEDALYYLGGMRLDRGDFEGAAAAWERLLDVNPRSGRAHARLGALHACLAPGAPFDPDRAEAEFRAVLAINPEQTGPLLDLATVALARDEGDAARQHLDRVLASDPHSALAHYLGGFLAWRKGDRAEAAARFRTALESARGAPPPAGFAGEGDTRQGQDPMLAASTPCREVAREADGLRELDPADDRRLRLESDRRYARLDALLRRQRSAAAPR